MKGKAGIVPAGLAVPKSYNEPIGPPSDPIDPLSFALESSLVLAKLQESIAQYKEVLKSDTSGQVASRCSVKEWEQESTKIATDDVTMGELKRWYDNSQLPGGGMNGDGGAQEDDEDEMNDDEERAPPGPAFAITHAKASEIVNKGMSGQLRIIKPITDAEYYLRRTRLADYNTLTSLVRLVSPVSASTSLTRHAKRHAVPPTSPPLSALSSLVYTLHFHTIPRYSSRIPFSVRAQTLVMLGSNTLYDLRKNLMVGGDGIPREIVEWDAEDDEGEEEDEDGENGHGRSKKRVKWSKEKRVVGSVFAIEGKLHADRSEGVVDYAQMIMSGIDSTLWSGSVATPAHPPPPHGAAPADASIDPSLSGPVPGLSNLSTDQDDEDDRSGGGKKSRVPQYSIGNSMQDTKIGDLNLRENAVYWYMHQGNCEHVWTVTSIRHIHPSDPTTLSSYPITTFLSRLSEPKCRLCDRDPGVIVTLNDELAGESPSLLCETCFDMLHGKMEDGEAEDGIEVVPTLPEYE